jgi:hypothetical protein
MNTSSRGAHTENFIQAIGLASGHSIAVSPWDGNMINGGILMSNRCPLPSIHFTFSVIETRPTILRHRQTRHLAAETWVTVFFKHRLDHARLYDSVVHNGG